MKENPNAEMRKLSDAELVSELAALEAAYQKLKFAHAVKPLSNTAQIKDARKQIARIQTEISARAYKAAPEEVHQMRTKIRARRKRGH
jgi:large subunit ribosomal protein L29